MIEALTAPQGDFQLDRYPSRQRTTLRAWDAADEHLLHTLAGESLGRVGLFNDAFGALAVALAGPAVVVNDSRCGQLGALANAARNDREAPTLATTLGALGPFDTVLIKVPKSLGRLEAQLHRIRAVAPGARIVGAGMARHIHTSTLDRFERLIGPTRTTRARKKARLIHCDWDPSRAVTPCPWPKRYALGDLSIVGHGGVFSAERLDVGTRLLLQHLPADIDGRAVDLGCGSGVVGLHLARAGATVTCVDDDAQAVASARASFAANGLAAAFAHSNCLDEVDEGAELVVINPPFHEGHAVGDAVAWDMFVSARGALTPGGSLLVVGNRHLGYHTKLKRLFGGCETLGANRKFVVLRARARPR